MSRWRTHHNRRRAHGPRCGGLFTLRYGRVLAIPTWGESRAGPDAILSDIRRAVLDYRGEAGQ